MGRYQKTEFQISTIPELSVLGGTAKEAFLDVQISSRAGAKDRKEILNAFAKLNRFLGMKMIINIVPGGGGGTIFFEEQDYSVGPRKEGPK